MITSRRTRAARALAVAASVATALLAAPLAARAADDPAAPPREVRFPHKPTGYADVGPVGPYYPERAARAGQTGVALIACQVAAEGALTACALVGDRPAGQNFGDAAMMMAKRGWILAAPRADGKPDAGEVAQFVVPFVLRGRR